MNILLAKANSSMNNYIIIRIISFLLFIALMIFIVIKLSKKPSQMKKGYKQLTLGMTTEEVISLLGQPTGRKIEMNKEILTWRISEFKGMARGGTKQRSIIANFENGKLTGYDSDNMGMSIF